MKITVFGANGKVGSLVVQNALENGHFVTAFVHGNVPENKNDNLQIFQGDIYDYESVDGALVGTEVVISALGSWGTKRKDILSEGMKNIIPAMQKHRINRIVSLTGHGARYRTDNNGFINQIIYPLFNLLARKIVKDGETHIDLLDKSELEWTVIRSPVMNTLGSKKYTFKINRPYPWKTINRQAVAISMLETATNGDFRRSAPFLTRK